MASTPVEIADSQLGFPPGFDPEDPFRYGWRYVTRTLPGGHLRKERVPLTLEDVLHPEEEDFIVQTSTHEQVGRYIADVCEARVADDASSVVLHDVRIFWGAPLHKAHGPDVAVIVGVRERKNWSTFDVVEEGVVPVLIAEITSPETAQMDYYNKLEEYAAVGVPYYVIVAIRYQGGGVQFNLLGYQLAQQNYAPLFPDKRGWLWLAPVRLWLSITDGAVVCRDETGQPLGDYKTLDLALRAEAVARQQAEERAVAAEQFAVSATERAVSAEERAVSATARAVSAEQRAAAETAAREEMEARLRTMEAELRRLRGE